MQPTSPPTLDEIIGFARRHGLDALTPEHLARMTELAVYVAELGRTLPRPTAKSDAPAFDPAAGPRTERGRQA